MRSTHIGYANRSTVWREFASSGELYVLRIGYGEPGSESNPTRRAAPFGAGAANGDTLLKAAGDAGKRRLDHPGAGPALDPCGAGIAIAFAHRNDARFYQDVRLRRGARDVRNADSVHRGKIVARLPGMPAGA
ncbi:hypothetical protein WT27_15650 [Burkholderia territorii]|uniref:Uncharacterized protein n=1 Tax=Burkholderia territorii TaxID=1503055 RepID=A0A106E7C7_9BURK|nr:hypothetical protein WT27_15650 [Burkholderia territorii]KVX42236.1 hypothetical protein WT31_28880 [Burkholderia territorii]